jgi:hypothetical protein
LRPEVVFFEDDRLLFELDPELLLLEDERERLLEERDDPPERFALDFFELDLRPFFFTAICFSA